MRRRTTSLALLALLGFGGGAAQAAPPAAPPGAGAQEAFRDLAAQVRRGLASEGKNGTESLAGLRQLRDPALRPLFAQLASSETGERQVQAILGLAELDDPPALDVFLVQQVKRPDDQARLLLTAHDLGLLPPQRLASLREKPGLPAEAEAALAAITMAEGGVVEPSVGKRLSATPGAPAVIGAIVGVQAKDPAAIDTLEAMLLESAATDRQALGAALDAIGASRATGAAPLVAKTLDAAQDDPVVRARCVELLLRLGAEDGPLAWSAAYDSAGDLAQRLRLALVCLDHPVALGSERLAPLVIAEESGVLRAIGVAATQASENRLSADALVALTETDHPACIAWALTKVQALPPPDAARVRNAAIARLRDKPSPPWALREQAARASADLLTASRDEFALAYSQAFWANRDQETQALLLGALQAKDSAGAAAISTFEPVNPTLRGLLAIAAARAGATLSESLADALILAAGGLGGLSDARRTQAAWLALKQQGQERSALAVVLTPEE